MHDIKLFLANLTHHPGVYQMLDEQGDVLYVGKAKDLKKRVSSYFSARAKDPKTQSLVKQIDRIDVTITHNENEAVLLECNLIKQCRPRYNILLRDDKSYPYIIITTDHPYPRIDSYRGTRQKSGRYFGPYPSSLAVRETINLIQKLFRIRTCRDSYYDARMRPCLLYQIGRCTAPCVEYISQENYAQSIKLAILFLEGKSDELIVELQRKMEMASTNQYYEEAALYRDQVNRLRQIQDKQYVNVGEGDADIIALALEDGSACVQLLSVRHGQLLGSRSYFPTVPEGFSREEIISAFVTQHYFAGPSHMESIPKLIILDTLPDDKSLLETVLSQQMGHRVRLSKPTRGDKYKWLQMALKNARQSLTLHQFNRQQYAAKLQALPAVVPMQQAPRRVECFDVSHTLGEVTVASCVVFDATGPLKSDYRRYNISDITPGDDVAALHQALMRRFKRLIQSDAKFPDLIIMDGGKPQLMAAFAVIKELGLHDIALMSVSKGPGRKPGFETLHTLDGSPQHLPSDSHVLHFIQQIRDEAHRFAITGHRARRDKVRKQSILESIPGVGAKRRRELLRYFGGIQGVAHASLDELIKVPGIDQSLAERIFATLHDKAL